MMSAQLKKAMQASRGQKYFFTRPIEIEAVKKIKLEPGNYSYVDIKKELIKFMSQINAGEKRYYAKIEVGGTRLSRKNFYLFHIIHKKKEGKIPITFKLLDKFPTSTMYKAYYKNTLKAFKKITLVK